MTCGYVSERPGQSRNQVVTCCCEKADFAKRLKGTFSNSRSAWRRVPRLCFCSPIELTSHPMFLTDQGNESSLINRLQNSLQAETLDGDNQYHCSRCNVLRDAQRSVQIDSVPPTLNFSLLRFVFDPKTFDRKKSKTMIKFPSRINMRPYMSDKAGNEAWYELKGVIEHRGTSVSLAWSTRT